MSQRTTSELAVAVDEGRADDVRVMLSGRLDVATAATARLAVSAATALLPRALDIDLSGVTDLDTAGLAAVTSPVMDARRAGIDVAIVPPGHDDARTVADRVRVLPLLGRNAP